jgi:hypothetical protein
MLLGSANLAKGEPVKAIEAFLRLEALAPQGPRGGPTSSASRFGPREVRGSEE